ncbi:MAG: flagellar basal body rod C-terminal domain-containing protein, partial [Pseudomonadota bacterium]
DRRLAEAQQVNAETTSGFLDRIERLLGTPDDPSSLSARLAVFDQALVTAASRPEAQERLVGAVTDARGVVRSLSDLSDGIQDARSVADRTIDQQVDQLTQSLQQVAELNSQITTTQVQGGDVASLQDLRQNIIDDISALVPLREVPRDNGQIALYSQGGAVLLDGTPAQIEYDRVNVVTPYMTQANGTLSELRINGLPVRTGSDDGLLRGGALGAQFAIRDELGVEAQTQVDALARDLITRFQDPAVDPSLNPGDAGLFTDSGGAFDPANEVGLSTRLSLNAAVDPDQGGEAWRIRDGINAFVPGEAGDATLLQNLSGALNTTLVPGSPGFGTGAFSAIDLVASVTSGVAGQRITADRDLSFASAQLIELTERQLADGVDTDAEFSRLLLIEQSYAANARVIETVDEMMQQILRL